MRFPIVALTLALSTVFSCSHPEKRPEAAPEETRLLPEQGTLRRKITTASEDAQKFFDQGLNLMSAFNLEEAQRSFAEAAKLDPEAAMAWWGLAYALGPHYNDMTLPPEKARAAKEAIGKAVAAMADETGAEKAMILAMRDRLEAQPEGDLKASEQAYSNSLREAMRRFPEDSDLAVLFAESMMNQRPWGLWTKDGKAQPGTAEIISTLESVLAREPDHTTALHLYIHAVEASPTPEKALAAADRLKSQKQVMGGGHLVHMPSHIYMRVGKYDESIERNQEATRQDRAYLDRAKGDHLHAFHMYSGHNVHFTASSAMMAGRSKVALDAAKELHAMVPAAMAASMPDMMDYIYSTPYQVMARFGMAGAALAEAAPPAELPVSRAIWHYARGLALAAKDDLAGARSEHASIRKVAAGVGPKAKAGQSPARTVVGIAEQMLAAEIASREGDTAKAISGLRRAVALEDQLNYDEPADWFQPARQVLGALLLRQGNWAEAERVYRADLAKNPENGWSLFGLMRALENRGANEKLLSELDERFRKAWAQADIGLPETGGMAGRAARAP